MILELPEQILKSIKLIKDADIKRLRGKIENIVISGVGGSGIGGEILSGLGYKYSPIPILTARDYTIPSVVKNTTLFFVVSYSGNTEETISTYLQAKRKRAACVVLTSGGVLKDLAEKNGDILIEIPPGLPPRQAIGFLFIPLLLYTSRLGFLPFKDAVIENTARQLKRSSLACDNIAKKLAHEFYQKIPYILASSLLYSSIAYRWKCQLNENAKTLSFFNTLPEQNHNEIEGIGRPEVLKDLLVLVVLYDPDCHKRIRRRLQFLPVILKGEYASFIRVMPLGSNELERLFSLIMIGDLVSYHLGALSKTEVEKIERIERLKKLLGGFPIRKNKNAKF